MKLKDCVIIEEDERSYAGPHRPADNDGQPTSSGPKPGHYKSEKGSLADEEPGEDEDRAEAGAHAPANESYRIVEGVDSSSLTSLDDDDEILGVPLNLDEACSISFDKHIDAIEQYEQEARDYRRRFEEFDEAQERKQEYDRRYKEMPRDRIKFK